MEQTSLLYLSMLGKSGGGGGSPGLRYAEGTITIDSLTTTPPTVTHNLGTKKVFALWWAEDGTEFSSYNVFAYQCLVNWWDIIPDDYSVTVNKGQQTEANVFFDKTKNTQQLTMIANSTDISTGAQQLSPSFEKTDNTLQLIGAYYTRWNVGTYHWLVVALP